MLRIQKLYRIEGALHANHLWFAGNCHDLGIYVGGGNQVDPLDSMFEWAFCIQRLNNPSATTGCIRPSDRVFI